MSQDLTARLAAWDGEAVIVRHDRPTGTWIFIAMHSSVLGRPTGGTRMRIYPQPADGLLDAQRLAEGMTQKWAVLDFPKGGGKAVLAIPRPLEGDERVGLLSRYGRLLASLQGSFATGEDLGTSPEDMGVIARQCRWVHGVEGHQVEDPGPFTARAVVAGVRAALERAFGSPDPAGRRVLVQGIGRVGGPVARTLAAAGAEILVSDVDRPRAEALAAELGGGFVAPDAVIDTACDVFSPCAVGGILGRESIGRLACRIVAGSANNQLETPEDADLLHRRGILYAPDYVINGGGAYAFGLLERGDQGKAAVYERMDEIGTTLAAILREAAERDESPLIAARRRVERVLAAGARASSPALSSTPDVPPAG